MEGRENGAGRQGRGNGRQGRGGGIVERCHGCNRDVPAGTISQHINKNHRHNGPDPKTAAEMNTAEGGLINRWLGCIVEGCGKVCIGENGMRQHSRMHARHNEADAAAEDNGAENENNNGNEENNNGAENRNNR